MSDDQRLIEDLIPVEAINRVSTDEKVGGRIGHPAQLHLWWARRPLAAARAAVFGTLMRADDATDQERSADYFRSLCRWGASDMAIAEARKRILESNGGTPPKVLDLFAGGGAIPLEAQRLGCEATAVELNPVAHLIERCMLEFPQRYGPGLADDIRKHGAHWINAAWDRAGHLYPRVREVAGGQLDMSGDSAEDRAAGRPIAYLSTRTVPCPNTERAAHVVPLVRQTWLAKKKGQHVALKPLVDRDALEVGWEVVEAQSSDGFDFDPAGFSTRGSTSCLACGAAVDLDYVKEQGKAGRMGIMPLAAVLVKESGRGRDYVAAGDYPDPDLEDCETVLAGLEVEPPEEPIPADDTRNFWTPQYGLTRFRDLFTPRQLSALCSLAQGVRETHEEMVRDGMEEERAAAVATLLALTLDRVVDRSSTLCRWDNSASAQKVSNTFARQALPMVWDFAEANPFGPSSGSVVKYLGETADTVESLASIAEPAQVARSSAQQLPVGDGSMDAVITDPPYYDNISYADLSDFFYVWLKRSVGFLYPEELGGELTPKRREAIVAPYRHDGSKDAAREFYETEMAKAFAEAHRVLKPGAPLVCVYAHKTTLGWASLVEALRHSGFLVTEAWPLDTEMPQRSIGQGTASLASSIFLVARRRETEEVGEYRTVLNQLDGIVKERLETLTEAGVTGSDLVIATMGAALRPYTQFASVELPNGEELPADRFLDEVQSRVLGAILREVHGLADGGGALDPATRYYVLARFSYGYGDVPFDEANNLARTAGVELEDGLVRGASPLAQSKSGKVHFYDFAERGENPELGLDGLRLIDVLHGLLWRAARRPGEVGAYLLETRPDVAKLRVVTQALQGRALRSERDEDKAEEAQACERLLGSWRTLVEDNLFTG